MPLPDVILNKPEKFLGLELFYDSFLELNDERQIGMAEGPIPWRAIADYCFAHEIEGEQREDLFFHVKQLDMVYLKYMASKRKG